MSIPTDSIKFLFLRPPKADKRRFWFVLAEDGGFEAIEDDHCKSRAIPNLFLERKHREKVEELIRLTEIELSKQKCTAVSWNLVRCIIAMLVFAKSKNAMRIHEVSSSLIADDSMEIFIGLPFEYFAMSPVGSELLQGFTLGPFKFGLEVEAQWRHGNEIGAEAVHGIGKGHRMLLCREPSSYRGVSPSLLELVPTELTDAYFSCVLESSVEDFGEELKSALNIASALGVATIDVDKLLSINQLVYGLRTASGHVTSYVLLNFNENIFSDNLSALGASDYGLDIAKIPLGQMPNFDEVFAKYCEYVHAASIHRINGRVVNAFIDCMIALDLLLGGKVDSVKNVSSRAAALNIGSLDDFFDLEKKIKNLYGDRSRLFHDGRQVSSDKLADIEKVCNLVTKAAMRMRGTLVSSNTDLDLDSWHKSLDFVVAGIKARKALTAADLKEVGIAIVPDGPLTMH